MWSLSLLLVGLLGLAWECSVRWAGLGPDYADNRALWLHARQQRERDGPRAVALLGASRMQRAIDVPRLSEALSRPVAQLAVEGSSAMPVLEDLASDPRFHGTVIYSVAPAFFFNRKLKVLEQSLQAQWVHQFRRQSRIRRLEQDLLLRAQGKLALRSPDAAMSRVIPALWQDGTLPHADHKATRLDRSVRIDYERMPGRADQQSIVDLYRKNCEPYEDEEYRAVLHYFATLVKLLEQKGGTLILLRLPSEGTVLQIEHELFPDDRFWNRLVQASGAQSIHFADHPELMGFLSRDGSHVDSSKASEFTVALAGVLQRRGLTSASAEP